MSFSQESIDAFFAWSNAQHIEYELKQLVELKERIISNTPFGERCAMEQHLSGIISQYINMKERIMSNTPFGERWAMEQHISGIILQYINIRFSK